MWWCLFTRPLITLVSLSFRSLLLCLSPIPLISLFFFSGRMYEKCVVYGFTDKLILSFLYLPFIYPSQEAREIYENMNTLGHVLLAKATLCAGKFVY
ncbi:hypothetical protein BDA99DRAFT_284697 [Phascolomyces articulosus]|uniref:Uncharacterized protein n=1 Tax=Phascolomyces articulosus TaxID=60185 RepID=A0AAD5K856_9FUNG|nr:hypothetical protein BDA99DRAFT_284697 [Phascolomyces articulosus]